MPQTARKSAASTRRKGTRTPDRLSGKIPSGSQRERLLDAMTELTAKLGYQQVSVAQVSSRAGVSSATFYEQFEDKEDCLIAAYVDAGRRIVSPPELTGGDSSSIARAAFGWTASGLAGESSRRPFAARRVAGRRSENARRARARGRRVRCTRRSRPRSSQQWLHTRHPRRGDGRRGQGRSGLEAAEPRRRRAAGSRRGPAGVDELLRDQGRAWPLERRARGGARGRGAAGARSADAIAATPRKAWASAERRAAQPEDAHHLRDGRGDGEQGLPQCHRLGHRLGRRRVARGLLRALRRQARRLLGGAALRNAGGHGGLRDRILLRRRVGRNASGSGSGRSYA